MYMIIGYFYTLYPFSHASQYHHSRQNHQLGTCTRYGLPITTMTQTSWKKERTCRSYQTRENEFFDQKKWFWQTWDDRDVCRKWYRLCRASSHQCSDWQYQTKIHIIIRTLFWQKSHRDKVRWSCFFVVFC